MKELNDYVSERRLTLHQKQQYYSRRTQRLIEITQLATVERKLIQICVHRRRRLVETVANGPAVYVNF
jgi:predicted RNA-binding protein Jag